MKKGHLGRKEVMGPGGRITTDWSRVWLPPTGEWWLPMRFIGAEAGERHGEMGVHAHGFCEVESDPCCEIVMVRKAGRGNKEGGGAGSSRRRAKVRSGLASLGSRGR